jgi:hypothetical protein
MKPGCPDYVSKKTGLVQFKKRCPEGMGKIKI